jgi:NTP pyrophosphatase (non-canonical NTP hydrolase)
MDFQTYQEQAATTAIYPRGELVVDRELLLHVFRMSEYVGKIQGIVKKAIRDNGGTISAKKSDELMILFSDLADAAYQSEELIPESEKRGHFEEFSSVTPYKHANLDLGQVYALLGLVNETGEVAEHVANSLETGENIDVQAVAKELGDVEWYQNAVATEFGFKMSEIAQANLDKLFSRKERGTLQGSGDNR